MQALFVEADAPSTPSVNEAPGCRADLSRVSATHTCSRPVLNVARLHSQSPWDATGLALWSLGTQTTAIHQFQKDIGGGFSRNCRNQRSASGR